MDSCQVTLTGVEGPFEDREFTFSLPARRLIGRAADCDICLPRDEEHRDVSRYHCELDIAPPRLWIRDLGSLNGTYVNGQLIGRRNADVNPEDTYTGPCTARELHVGDELQVGDTVFRVKVENVESVMAPMLLPWA